MQSGNIKESSNPNAEQDLNQHTNDKTCFEMEQSNSYHRLKRERSSSPERVAKSEKKLCCCQESCSSKQNTNEETNSDKISDKTNYASRSSSSNYKYNSNSNGNNSPIQNTNASCQENLFTTESSSAGMNENINASSDKNDQVEFKFFIGGIPQHITTKEISDYFEKYGTVENVTIAHDHRTKRNRGFAFVTMSSQENKDKIMTDSHELNGKRVDIREENDTTPSDMQRKIFVGGLNYFWTKDVLTQYFSSFGEIESVQIVLDSSGRSRCFGFVIFKNEISVVKVLKNKKYKIHDKLVEVRKAEPKKPKKTLKKTSSSSTTSSKDSSKGQSDNTSNNNVLNPFLNMTTYNKELMTHWANFMYQTCGVPPAPLLLNQRFPTLPDLYANYGGTYYPPVPLDNNAQMHSVQKNNTSNPNHPYSFNNNNNTTNNKNKFQ